MYVVYLDVGGDGKSVPVPCEDLDFSKKFEGLIELTGVTQSRDNNQPDMKVDTLMIRLEQIVYISSGSIPLEDPKAEPIPEAEPIPKVKPDPVESFNDQKASAKNWNGRLNRKDGKKESLQRERDILKAEIQKMEKEISDLD